ncbi:MAG: protein TolR [Pseudomonadota bacterium]|nr:protein TolR [Porticoccaceae bacterium]MEC7158416.1 protein TolR [Pseudomonadota bacterium]MEC7455199.1 protein TolR [Pseudomonadota bacterium]MEC7620133.1 protein TolR [Pseudomonadota bacterium]MEC7636925.1 protein TolR [Pseudomonadota bacterium]
MRSKHKKRKLVAEINVIPYVDVTFVLLVVFMVTAPLLMQGVQVNLPAVDSAPIKSNDNDPFIVSIKNDGSYWIDQRGENQNKNLNEIKQIIEKILSQSPEKQILIWGDEKVDYGSVVLLMSELQKVGATSVGLITDPPRD